MYGIGAEKEISKNFRSRNLSGKISDPILRHGRFVVCLEKLKGCRRNPMPPKIKAYTIMCAKTEIERFD